MQKPLSAADERMLAIAIDEVVEGIAPANVGPYARASIKIALLQRMGSSSPTAMLSRLQPINALPGDVVTAGKRVDADPRFAPLLTQLVADVRQVLAAAALPETL
jgi:hypothetical protein